jgi:hypothetical protein
MDPLVLFAQLPLLERAIAGRTIARVLPVGRRGLHVVFEGSRLGLRLDTAPAGGAALLLATPPARVRGGRGAWLDVAAALDRDLAGRPGGRLRVAGRPPALEWAIPGAALLHWIGTREGAVLRVETARGAPCTIPDGRRAPAIDEPAFLAGVAALAESWRSALGGPVEGLPARLAAAVPGLGVRGAERLVARASGSSDPTRTLAGIADRLEGRDQPAAVSGMVRADEAPRASWRGALRVELIAGGAEPQERSVPCAELGEALALWYEASLAAEELAGRRDAAFRLIRRETEKARRAVAAMAREESTARPAAELRRLADALLAAGPHARLLPEGLWRIPDPCDPSQILEVPADPPGRPPHEAATRLYARARRSERGRATRAERSAGLAGRIEALEGLLEKAAAADLGDEIDAVEDDLRGLGVAAGRALEAVSAAIRGPGAETGGARLQRSPSGFLVLAGRSARQNDALTFRTAAPEDLWFHVLGRPGAHVVLRTEGKDVPHGDLLFAAELAASLSGVADGEAVDVAVARRKHLRRPRGGEAGQVVVTRSRTLHLHGGRKPVGGALGAGPHRPRS